MKSDTQLDAHAKQIPHDIQFGFELCLFENIMFENGKIRTFFIE